MEGDLRAIFLKGDRALETEDYCAFKAHFNSFENKIKEARCESSAAPRQKEIVSTGRVELIIAKWHSAQVLISIPILYRA